MQAEAERLQNKLRDAEAALSRANPDLESIRTIRPTEAATMVEQRAQVDQLSAKILEQAETIELDRRLPVP